MKSFLKFMLGIICATLCCSQLCGQSTMKGKVVDKNDGFSLPGAAVIIEGTNTGVTTDMDGNFELSTTESLPLNLTISFLGYRTSTFLVTEENKSEIFVKLGSDAVLMDAVEVKAQRVSEKQRQAALTVETMDVLAIKEAASGDFYESLGALKDVDVTSASLGFKVINTRGFNSTSPVRSLQIIDLCDNQSPGLNFSLGNFLGTSDLDLKSVEIVAGASSAYYGPGAFNGVVSMTTKDPFQFPGVSMELKFGERALVKRAVRIAATEGKAKRFGWKLNLLRFEANDWEATNYDPIQGSSLGADHPFGFDAVNIYGDEDVSFNNDNSDNLLPTSLGGRPGLTRFLRNGYRENDLLDYDTDNSKFNTGLYYKLNDKITTNYSFSYSTGNTIYQGDNRYALRGIEFFQHKLEIGEKGKWFLRGYRTSEDAGDTYDVVTTALRMQEAQSNNADWNTNYLTFWSQNIVPILEATGVPDSLFQHVLAQGYSDPDSSLALYNQLSLDWINNNTDFFSNLHQQNLETTNSLNDQFIQSYYEPGTARFDSLFNSITQRTFTEGGSRFFDKSKLSHIAGEYKFEWNDIDFTVGGNARFYSPDSRGTIFSDTLSYIYAKDSLGNNILVDGQRVKLDSSRVSIRNSEWGSYFGLEKKFKEEKLITNATVRLDKNQNFDPLLSPAVSLVYVPDDKNTYRLSFSSAIRNPTLADQYLFYNVGRAILLGNIDGRFEQGNDSLITIDSFSDFRTNLDRDTLQYFNVESIRPEQVRTVEAGYRGKLSEELYVDLGAYYSRYTDFIGFELGISAFVDPVQNTAPTNVQVYRVASNAKSIVTTSGFSLGMNYYFKKSSLSGNYSFNELVSGDDDPIIPAFNTPKNKFNLGLSARELMLFKKIPHFGYGINYKWIQGFLFEGSPQFTGSIPTYDMLDAQVNVFFPQISTTLKIGGSNILGIRPLFAKGVENRLERAFDNKNLQVYGGPSVGRLLYVSFQIDLK